MLKFISLITLLTVLFFQITVVAHAQDSLELTPTEPITNETINQLNPLFTQNTEGEVVFAPGETTPASLIQRLITFAFPIAGLLLFVMLVWSGLEILLGATEKKSLDAGRNRATAAVVGFILLFATYWIIQLVEVILNVSIITGF